MADTATRCPICHELSTLQLGISRHTYFRCVGCHTSFCSPKPTESELNEYYSSYHLSDEDGGVYDSVENRMIADFPAKLNLMRKFGGTTKLLDVGCGKGYFVKYCRDQGIDAQGIDVSESAVQYAAENFQFSIHHGTLENCASLDPIYDSISLWATIEHLSDPRATIEAAVSRLKVGGFLHLDTGIGYDWLDRLLPGYVQWFDPPQHLFVFSATGLRMLLEQCGLRIVRHERCFERSLQRKVIRTLRCGTAALSCRCVATLLGLTKSMNRVTRYPLGNLQSVSAQKV